MKAQSWYFISILSGLHSLLCFQTTPRGAPKTSDTSDHITENVFKQQEGISSTMF